MQFYKINKHLIIIIILVFSFVQKSISFTYYIDSENGDDFNDGMSAEGAWKSLNRVNEQKFLPNDSILLRRDRFYRGTITLKWSGKKGMPIVIGAFGEGVPPFIAGSVSVKVWRKLSEKDIWWSPASVNPVWIWLVKKDGDPESTGSIEAAAVDYCLGTTRPLQHICIENLEIAFAAKRGIRSAESGSNWIIKNNIIHHIGNRIEESGDGITHYASFSNIKSNTIYECGNHGIYIVSDKTVSQGNLVKKNTVYNCYHNCIDLMNRAGVHTSTVVRDNTVYCTTDFTYRNIKSRGVGANGIYTSGKNESPLKNCIIVNNLIVNCVQMNIHIGKFSDSIFIINNTMYSTQTFAVPRTACLYVNTDGVVYVRNNIGTNGGKWAFRYTGGQKIEANYNCWYQPHSLPLGSIGNKTYFEYTTYQKETGLDKNSLFCNPDFKRPSVDIGSADFSLMPGSCCIGAGDRNSIISGLLNSQGTRVDIGVIESERKQ